MSDWRDDALWRQLAGLTPAVPDPVYSATVRARCQIALARRHRNDATRTESPAGRGRALEAFVVAGFAFVYVVSVVLDALASYGVL